MTELKTDMANSGASVLAAVATQLQRLKITISVQDLDHTCQVCFSNTIRVPFCGSNGECYFCKDCSSKYIETQLAKSFGMLPEIKCPGCRCVTPFRQWKKLVRGDVTSRAEANAKSCLLLRCSKCHGQHTLLPSLSRQLQSDRARLVAAVAAADEKLAAAWEEDLDLFESGNMSCDAFIGVVKAIERAILPRADDDPTTYYQRRGRYISFKRTNPVVLNLKANMNVGSRRERRVSAIRLEEVMAAERERLCITKKPSQYAHDAFLHKVVAPLVTDIERRCALMMRSVNVSPTVLSACCKVTHCFRCQVAGHHSTIQDCSAALGDATIRLCPHCSIALMKGDGCSHMTCVCGKSFTWTDAKKV